MAEIFYGYYISFKATGNPAIDAILKEVARSAKGSHSTDSWYELGYTERIQNAANAAAKDLPEPVGTPEREMK